MSSRKQCESRTRRYRKQTPSAVHETAFTPAGIPAIDPETGQIVTRSRPNRALRRRLAAEQRRSK